MKISIRRVFGVLSAALVLSGAGLIGTGAWASAQPAPVIMAATPLVFDINGTYSDGGSALPVISDGNDILTVDMSSQHRPTASGVVVDSDTILVTFPDDATYGGKLEAPATIRWSNGSTWHKVSLVNVPDVTGLPQAQAVSILRSASLTSTTVTESNLDCTLAGKVDTQNPAPGTSVLPGSVVTLKVFAKPPKGSCT